MASKRSSRLFVDDTEHSQENQQKTTNTPFRSRRSSRSSIKEDMMQSTKDAEEGLTNGLSIRDSTNMTRSHSLSAVSMESSKSSSSTTSESSGKPQLPPPADRVMTDLTLASSMSTYQSHASGHPPAPLNGRPHNFGVVVPGVYRSSFPKSHDFEYIKGLKLKTIVSLVKKEEFDHDLETFVAREGIRQVVFNMKGTKKETIPLKTMKSILSIVLNKENYPLLIHCNHGKHRTGCVVGVVRKVAGWDVQSVIAEYKSYAEPKARECDVEYLGAFQVSTLRTSNDVSAKYSRPQMTTFFRALIFSTFVLLIWLLSGTRLSAAATRPNNLLL
ncbi:tyrosine- phosphatase SIW14 [Fusarium albosuccineum]|uniref:Tyrosine- phosphatase SIW14 n=1 Tax=Fusarium albosuccineum TaxID=1237068 RepID=A0A8H4PIP6_9HYPO|nr:tyrosine- phosphatase SIW14 [Fusarium albosuccineum]